MKDLPSSASNTAGPPDQNDLAKKELAAPPFDESTSSVEDDTTSETLPSRIGPQGIVYHDLTFDTELPSQPVLPAGSSQDLPPYPDLSKYQNPLEWPLARKRLITWTACACNATAAYAVGSYASPSGILTQKWHVSNVAYTIGIALFTLGFGAAPMVLAPFSEINGRRPVFVITGVLFVLLQLCCALTRSYAGMLVSRFLLGCAGSTFSAMVGGILADIWITSERNTAMVLFTGATLVGTGLGPLVSGFVTQHLDWRWVFYLQVISSGTLVTLVILSFKETRGSILLSRRVKALNKWYEELEAVGCIGMQMPTSDLEKPTPCKRIRWRVQADGQRASLFKMIAISLYRPMHMLFTESVVFWFSLWMSFAWSCLYLQFNAIPLIYETVYGFTLEQSGAVFAAVSIGAIISTVLSIYQEKIAMRHYSEKIGGSPEGRLYFTCVEAFFLPIGIFWFGWTCVSTIHWIVPTIAVGFITIGIFSIYLATFNYAADVYHIYASSALAANGMCRNLLGGSFPLVTDQMFKGLGYSKASSLLGAIATALSFVPWVLVFFGPKIRARSRIAKQFIDQE